MDFVILVYSFVEEIKNFNLQIEFLKLVDLTHDMTEPCIIDIKIGKRTWDPTASEEKILLEEVSQKCILL